MTNLLERTVLLGDNFVPYILGGCVSAMIVGELAAIKIKSEVVKSTLILSAPIVMTTALMVVDSLKQVDISPEIQKGVGIVIFAAFAGFEIGILAKPLSNLKTNIKSLF